MKHVSTEIVSIVTNMSKQITKQSVILATSSLEYESVSITGFNNIENVDLVTWKKTSNNASLHCYSVTSNKVLMLVDVSFEDIHEDASVIEAIALFEEVTHGNRQTARRFRLDMMLTPQGVGRMLNPKWILSYCGDLTLFKE